MLGGQEPGDVLAVLVDELADPEEELGAPRRARARARPGTPASAAAPRRRPPRPRRSRPRPTARRSPGCRPGRCGPSRRRRSCPRSSGGSASTVASPRLRSSRSSRPPRDRQSERSARRIRAMAVTESDRPRATGRRRRPRVPDPLLVGPVGARTRSRSRGAEGRYFWDYDGKRYLDFASQLVNLALGHQHPKLVAAIKEQADAALHDRPADGERQALRARAPDRRGDAGRPEPRRSSPTAAPRRTRTRSSSRAG